MSLLEWCILGSLVNSLQFILFLFFHYCFICKFKNCNLQYWFQNMLIATICNANCKKLQRCTYNARWMHIGNLLAYRSCCCFAMYVCTQRSLYISLHTSLKPPGEKMVWTTVGNAASWRLYFAQKQSSLKLATILFC